MFSVPYKSASRLLYSRVNIREMSGDIESGGRKSRQKTVEKEGSWKHSTGTKDTEEDFEEERQTKRIRRKNAFWKIGIAGFAGATISTNVYCYLTFGGTEQMLACWLICFISVYVAFCECTMPDVNGE